MFRKSTFAAIAALSVMSTAALASVTVDSTGHGFVGKGDVQLALGGWNDAALQRNASGVTFTYNVDEQYKYDCTFTVEVGRDKHQESRTQNRGKNYAVNATVVYDSRKNNQGKITGFNLNGFGAVTTTGEAPVDGGSCVGGPLGDGVISNVELIGTSGGGLNVNYGGLSVPLPNTPVIVI